MFLHKANKGPEAVPGRGLPRVRCLVLEKGARWLWQGEVCLTGGLPGLRKAFQQDLQRGEGRPNHMKPNQE